MYLKTTVSLALALALVSGSGAAFAQAMSKSGKPLTAQQTKMKDCNAEAKTKALAGADRKAFMKTCLSGSTATTAPAATTTTAAAPAAKQTQQQKMKTCSADAKTKALKGDERKAYMKTCLSGEGASAH